MSHSVQGVSPTLGMDTMTWAKGVAAVLVFLGVGIVNFSPHAKIY